ncbi:MAG: membrane-bound lytic murein transglycosylase MltF [Parahaliea sp.]
MIHLTNISAHITLITALLLCLLAGCSDDNRLEDIRKRGELLVVTRSGPASYYLNKNGAAGFEYDLARLFAQELEVELNMQPAVDMDGIFRRLQRGEADIAAASLSLTPQWESRYLHSHAYGRQTALVIYKTGSKRPRKAADLGERELLIVKGSSHLETLRQLSEDYPALHWREIEEADSMELLEMVENDETLLAVINSNEFSLQQSFYPRLARAFDLNDPRDMTWYFPKGEASEELRQTVNSFFDKLRKNGQLEQLREQHFGHASVMSRIDAHTFTLNMKKVLPDYEDMIRQVAGEYQLDWHLLAAVAYQESHWNPKAISPTGVRGMMMLTIPTARELGIKNRLDPLQSLRGGARYLKDSLRRLTARISEPDRTWMALAAYNIGLGHLEDARILTQKQGADPNQWTHVLERLPLLQKRQFYRDTRYGYARGQEAATYVQNIRHYYSVLQWQASPVDQWSPPINPSDYLPDVLRGMSFRAL